MTTRVECRRALIRRVASKPFIPGIDRSIKTRSGKRRSVLSTASAPDVARATTSQRGSEARNRTSWRRNSALSSTRRIRTRPPSGQDFDLLESNSRSSIIIRAGSPADGPATIGRFGSPGLEKPESPGAGLPLGRNETDADRVADQAGDVVDVQFFHELSPVGLDGLHAHAEQSGDLLGGVSFGNQLEDFALPKR